MKGKTTTMAVALVLMAAWLTAQAGRAEAKDPHNCTHGEKNKLRPSQDGGDLTIQGLDCLVQAGTYKFGNVNILEGGTLRFADANIDFWAANIVVEKGGRLLAGVDQTGKITPIANGVVTIHLYGNDQTCADAACTSPKAGTGVKCVTDKQCGVPDAVWSNGSAQGDTFYMYHPLPRDDADPLGYFGYKVLAVSYGGTLQLFGKKGATYGATGECGEAPPTTSGTSWARLNATAKAGSKTLTVDRKLSLKAGDQIVVTTTDYLPGHSEQLTVAGDVSCGDSITVNETLKYDHVGTRYSLSAVPDGILDPTLKAAGAETRAAVGLLTRSIRIVSEGDTKDQSFPAAPPPGSNDAGYYFGGHLIVRQGFTTFQVQGVEFYQMGQGGRLGHYPVHFHHARKTPADTFVKDSSIHDSMTRWIALHGTHGVTLERNVGYKSIGHGFYLEDGTEINNTLTANLGIFARAAVVNDQNPRKVPGILADPNLHGGPGDNFPSRSDYNNPTVFWIMNGWNDFKDNMAAGAGTCGACYWLVPGYNSGMSKSEQWDSYASMQNGVGRAGMTPLKSFVGNFCTSAMMAFQTVGNTADCNGVQVAGTAGDFPTLPPVKNPLATGNDYYPSVDANGARFATQCDGGDCSSSPPRCGDAGDGTSRPECMVTVLDKFTTSFNWAQFTVAAIWLRQQWFLVTDSVITDVQNAGVTMVTGGGYYAGDVVPGHWALLRKSALIGHTQEDNPFASNGGPFNPQSGLRCAENPAGSRPGNYCLSIAEGVSHQVTNFGMYQRLFSVYDGPAFQDSNAYLNIKTRTIDDCDPVVTDSFGKVGQCKPRGGGKSQQSAWAAGFVQGLPKSDDGKTCYMPNAAIGWKQPNGFYYPPAFHSANLFFKDVETRHFVVTPLFQAGTLDMDIDGVEREYCIFDKTLFNGFTSIDRQTVLNDDDGTLTGYRKTTVINLDDFFAAPVDAIECKSDNTSRTSPYEYVTTVVYPGCLTPRDQCDPDVWARDCTSNCTGIPLFRQDQMPEADKVPPKTGSPAPKSIRMMGQNTGQRSELTANHGTYYLDTATLMSSNQFKNNETYYLFLIFAKPDSAQKYRFFVGQNTTFDLATGIQMVQADVDQNPIIFAKPQSAMLPAGRVTWFGGAQATQASAQGVVEVDLRVSDFPGVAKKYQDARKKKCQPATYCTWNEQANSGQGACEDINPRPGAAKDAVCRWANADLHCPDGGCIGIVFTMPDGFEAERKGLANPDSVRPAATCLPKAPPWDVSLKAVPDDPDPKKAVCPDPNQTLAPDFCK